MTSTMAPSSPPPPPSEASGPTHDSVTKVVRDKPSSSSSIPTPSFAENDPLPAFDLTPLPQPSDLRRSSSMPPPPPKRAAAEPASPARTIPAPAGVSSEPKIEVGPSATERALSLMRSLRAKMASPSGGDASAKIPGFLRSKVAGVPVSALFASGIFLAAVVVVGVRFGMRSDTPKSQVEASRVPSNQEVEATAAPAAQAREEKLVANAGPPGDETQILLAQAERLLAERRDTEVGPLLDRALARNPELKGDTRVAKILRRTASSDDRMAAADGFAMLTGPMGEKGAEVLYEISLDEKVRKGVRVRADSWLHSKDFDRTASLPLYAAVKLRSAKTCEAKQSLVEFAADAGDKHVLEYLRELDKKTVCSPEDLENCYPCMRSDTRLENSIAKLAKRIGG
jgi:hypothetical protein